MIRNIFTIISLVIISLSVSAQYVVMPAEFEKNEGVILKWNYDAGVDSTIARIASIISADDSVWMLYDPANAYTQTQIRNELTIAGANFPKIRFISGKAENPWVRDYITLAGYSVPNDVEKRYLIDPQYFPAQFPLGDQLPAGLAATFNFEYASIPLQLEGGNLLVDGTGRVYVSDKILTENPGLTKNQICVYLNSGLNLNETIILPSIPECGGGEWSELSRIVKFIDDETALVAKFPPTVPYYNQVEKIADTLTKLYNDMGKTFSVIRIPVAPNSSGNYASTSNDEIRSYTSAIVFNNKILIPKYDNQLDNNALNIYKQLYPGYEYHFIPAKVLSQMHGSLYRLAVNIPQPKLFRIRHSKISGQQYFECEIWANSFVNSFNPIDSMLVFYRVHPSDEFVAHNSNSCCGGNSSPMNGYSINDTISYYLKAYMGNFSQTLPLNAPETTYTFWFDLYTGPKAQVSDQLISVFPNPASNYFFVNGLGKIDPEASFNMLNINGVSVTSGHFESGNKILIPDYLVNGLYLIKISNFGKSHTTKLYLQR